MKKILLAAGSIAAALTLAFTAACTDNSAVKYTVSFDSMGGSAVEAQQVKEGEFATEPEDPTRDGYLFTYWYSDEECGEDDVYNFAETPVTEDITLYAGWVSSEGSATATFYWNYQGAAEEVYETVYFTDGGRLTKPADPSRGSDYYFAGWYTDQQFTTEYSAMKKYEGNQSFYAKWLSKYTFEAENTQLTGLVGDYALGLADQLGNKKGQGYSNNPAGKALIVEEGQSGANASGGYYVTSLYYNGAYLEWEITSDVAVDDAMLYVRLSSEYFDAKLTDDNFKITVNGEELSFNDINLTGAITDMSSMEKRPFSDHGVGNISLKAGVNKIRLTVNNSDKPMQTGTMAATAPMFDCIYVYSTSDLTMKEFDNI